MNKAGNLDRENTSLRLLTPQQMYAADAATIAAGTPGMVLMENAGKAIFREIVLRWSKRPVVVLCGPGNNGGDGYVVARLLQQEGWPVRVAALGDPGKLNGDAKLARTAWQESVEALTLKSLNGARLMVDALFGAGLARPVDGMAAEIVRAVNDSAMPVVAVDTPSGVDGATGQKMGETIRAHLTVTFCRRKPGHLLLPGRDLCGETVCADIGVTIDAIAAEMPQIYANAPALWPTAAAMPASNTHKYHRGHALVVSGPAGRTGAARLAAGAALSAGAGLVTVASPANAMAENASQLTAVMLTPFDGPADLESIVRTRKISAIAIGPGCGVHGQTRALVRVALSLDRPLVLDADALTSFEADPGQLFEAIAENPARSVVLTPHEGEFRRIFSAVAKNGDSKWQRAAEAARASNAVVVLKGADTVIAAPNGPVAINENAPPTLATAGSGDVLTGILCAQMAGATPAFEAACAAVWLHGKSAQLADRTVTAEDLISLLPGALKTIC